MAGPLDGITVLDLTRVLAGPTCTQLLGDMGADVIKVENPGTEGDDTRGWGPPFVESQTGESDRLSTYFMSANRNKRSIAVDLSTGHGQEVITELAARSDILVENFRPGSLRKFNLDYKSLRPANPRIIYCSISSFGQTGPNRAKPGYDLMAQGYGGIMSLTGEPSGEPMKVGVGVSDIVCGLYASTAVLAALRARDLSGVGQSIDISLVDSQIAWLVYEGVSFLATGETPIRRGNGHPNICPYELYQAADGYVIIAVGNDGQFKRLAGFLGRPELATDSKYSANTERLRHRDALNDELRAEFATLQVSEIIEGLDDAGVPVGPVNDLEAVFKSDQVEARDMVVEMDAPSTASGRVRLIGNPVKFSETPVSYRTAPPRFGQHTEQILSELKKPR